MNWKKNHFERTKELQNDWAKKNIDAHNLAQKKYSQENPKIVKAQWLSRKVLLKESCGICKTTENLEKHHWRYDKPKLVSTLCKECHEIQHIKYFDSSVYGGRLP